MKAPTSVATALVAALIATTRGDTTYQISDIFDGSSCGGNPGAVAVATSTPDACQTATCSNNMKLSCVNSTNGTTVMQSAAGKLGSYFAIQTFTDNTCTTLSSATAISTSGSCYAAGGNQFYKVTVGSDGGVSYRTYNDSGCATLKESTNYTSTNLGVCTSGSIFTVSGSGASGGATSGGATSAGATSGSKTSAGSGTDAGTASGKTANADAATATGSKASTGTSSKSGNTSTGNSTTTKPSTTTPKPTNAGSHAGLSLVVAVATTAAAILPQLW